MQPQEVVTDPVQAAKDAGLRYVSDVNPGIMRKRCGKGFRYIGIDVAPMRDPEVLARIKSLAIPPAWTDVWICPNPRGALAGDGTGRERQETEQV